MTGWYFLVGRERIGPVSDTGLKVLVEGGGIPKETAVWKEGMSGWTAVREVDSLDAPAPKGIAQANGSEQGGGSSDDPGDLWFMDGNGQKQGPLSREDFLVLAQASWMTEETLIWSPTLRDWTAAGKSGLFRWTDFLPPPKSKLSPASPGLKRSLGGAAKVAGKAAMKAASSAAGAGRGVMDRTRKTASSAKQVLEKNWTKIEAAVVDKAVPLVLEGLKDDELLGAVLERVYEVLPMPIRMAVPRRFFLGFCLKRRAQLLGRIRENADQSRPSSPDGDSDGESALGSSESPAEK